MILCSICCSEVLESTGSQHEIQCKMCLKSFHGKCAKVNKSLCELFKSRDNCFYYCDQCKSIAAELTKISGKLQSLEGIISEHSSIINEQKAMISELKSKLEVRDQNPLSTPFLSARNYTNTRKKRKFGDVVRDWAVDSEDTRTPLTHTTATFSIRKRKKLSVPLYREKKDYDPIVVIKPRDDVDEIDALLDILSDVKKVVNPRDDPVKNIRRTAKGNVILECNDQQSVQTIMDKVGTALRDKCCVDVPRESIPEIKLVGLHEDMTSVEIESQLRVQNPEVICETATIKVKAIKKIVTLKTSYHTVYLQTDNLTLNKIIDRGTLKLMWSSLKCYQVLPDNRCYRCHSFKHIAADCELTEEQSICPKCAGNHVGRHCTSNFVKCKNCNDKNAEYGTNLPVDHPVWSYQCPILKKRHDRLRENIRYKQ